MKVLSILSWLFFGTTNLPSNWKASAAEVSKLQVPNANNAESTEFGGEGTTGEYGGYY